MGLENLSLLHSFNRGGVRQLNVVVSNGTGVTSITVDFNIDGKHYFEHVTLESGERRSVGTSHREGGRRFVVVKASGFDYETSKWLDLDALESF